MILLRSLAALLLLLSWSLGAWTFAQRLLPEDRVLRGLAVLVLLPWMLNLAFWALAGPGCFRLEIALFVSVAVAAALGWWRREPMFRFLGSDLRRLGGLGREAFSGWALVVSLPVASLAGLRLLRGTLAPPLAWDALTYRLFKAGTWVQTGSWALEPAPDAWGYYRFFPAAGEVLWAWAMLPFGSDLGIAAGGFLAWLGAGLALYLAGRSIGAEDGSSLWTALILLSLPVLLTFLASSYVHGLVTLYAVAGSSFILAFFRSGLSREAFLAGAAFGLAQATHPGALPLVAAGGAAILVGVVRQRAWKALAPVVLATVVTWPWMGFAWMETGSPLYPLHLEIGGVELFEGHPQLDRLHRGESLIGQEELPVTELIALQVWERENPRAEMLSLGPGALLLLGLAGLGGFGWWRSERAGPLLSLALFAAAFLPALTSAAGAMHTTWGAPMLGRHLVPGFAVLIWAATRVSAPWAQGVRAVAAWAGVWWGRPLGFGAADWAALGELARMMAPILLGVVFLLAVGWWIRRLRTALVAAAVLVVPALLLTLLPLRDAHRLEIWAAPPVDAYDLHPLEPRYSKAWPLWAAVAEAPGLRIAFTAGWDGVGHNWYRYPFLGTRLQNRVYYVPVTPDGEILDYQEMGEVVEAADFETWLRRLVEHRVDLLVTAPPDTLEGLWARDHPAIFELSVVGVEGRARAYRIDRRAAREALGIGH